MVGKGADIPAMKEIDVVKRTLGEFLSGLGFRRRSGAWYRKGSETITVIELQCSQYSAKYYLNIGLWLLALGNVDYPKEMRCHIRTRLTELFPDQDDHIERMLDLTNGIADSERVDGLLQIFNDGLLSTIENTASIASLETPRGREFLSRSLQSGPALAFLADIGPQPLE